MQAWYTTTERTTEYKEDFAPNEDFRKPSTPKEFQADPEFIPNLTIRFSENRHGFLLNLSIIDFIQYGTGKFVNTSATNNSQSPDKRSRAEINFLPFWTVPSTYNYICMPCAITEL